MTTPTQPTAILTKAGKYRTERQQASVLQRRTVSLGEALGCLYEAHDPAKHYCHSGVGSSVESYLYPELSKIDGSMAAAKREADIHQLTAEWLIAVTPVYDAITALRSAPLPRSPIAGGWPPPLRGIRRNGKLRAREVLREFGLNKDSYTEVAQVQP